MTTLESVTVPVQPKPGRGEDCWAILPVARTGSRKRQLLPDRYRRILKCMDVWTIEVADGHTASARSWRREHGERLVEAALTHGAKEWNWVSRGWGVLLEITFADESDWLRFRGTPAVQAALDAAPDPVAGRWIYPGRGGSSTARVPRRPRPIRSSDGAPIPEPEPGPELWQHPLGRRQARMPLERGDLAAK